MEISFDLLRKNVDTYQRRQKKEEFLLEDIFEDIIELSKNGVEQLIIAADKIGDDVVDWFKENNFIITTDFEKKGKGLTCGCFGKKDKKKCVKIEWFIETLDEKDKEIERLKQQLANCKKEEPL